MTSEDLQTWLGERNLDEGANEVLGEYHVTMDEIVGRDRTPRVSYARQHLWAFLELSGFSQSEVSRLFERNHTTVMAGIKAHYKRKPPPPLFETAEEEPAAENEEEP